MVPHWGLEVMSSMPMSQRAKDALSATMPGKKRGRRDAERPDLANQARAKALRKDRKEDENSPRNRKLRAQKTKGPAGRGYGRG